MAEYGQDLVYWNARLCSNIIMIVVRQSIEQL